MCILQEVPGRRAIDRIFHGERTAHKLKDMNQNVDIFETTRAVELKALSARRQRLETMLRAVTMSVLSKNYDMTKITDVVSPGLGSVLVSRGSFFCVYTVSFVFQDLDVLVKQVIGKSTSLMANVLKDQESLEEFVEKCKRGGIFAFLAEPLEGPANLERGIDFVLRVACDESSVGCEFTNFTFVFAFAAEVADDQPVVSEPPPFKVSHTLGRSLGPVGFG